MIPMKTYRAAKANADHVIHGKYATHNPKEGSGQETDDGV